MHYKLWPFGAKEDSESVERRNKASGVTSISLDFFAHKADLPTTHKKTTVGRTHTMGKVEKVDDVIQEGTFNDGDQTIAVTVGVKLETYSLKSYPKQDAGAVVAAKQEVIGDVSLETMLTDLERAGDMLYLAFVGLKGTKLAGRVGSRQKDLAILCSDCVAAMRALESGSRKVVGSLIKAFKWLQKGQEARALKVVQRCGKEASNMSEKCTGLAGRFEEMSKETKADSEMTEEALAARVKEIEEIKGTFLCLPSIIMSLISTSIGRFLPVCLCYSGEDPAVGEEGRAGSHKGSGQRGAQRAERGNRTGKET